jgi:hypothetical protein
MQEIRGAKKFRHVGVEPSLKNKFDRMYSNIVATGEFAWAPSSGVPAAVMSILVQVVPTLIVLVWKKKAVIWRKM